MDQISHLHTWTLEDSKMITTDYLKNYNPKNVHSLLGLKKTNTSLDMQIFK